MFFHAYKYKLKSLFREKETFFWIMFFPLILGTFFFMAFSKISSQTENFSTINVAVCADDTDDTAYFKEVIENLYADDRKEVPFSISHIPTGNRRINFYPTKKQMALSP